MNWWNALVGLVCGALSGIGVGGGTLLMVWLTAIGDVAQTEAQGINLLYFLPTALCAIIVHLKNGYVKWRSALASVIFGVPGVFLGSYIAGAADKELLRTLFAVFLLLVGVRELFGKK